ncbi:hypothetical protein ACVJBD_003460 [Rhizobium mongolense]
MRNLRFNFLHGALDPVAVSQRFPKCAEWLNWFHHVHGVPSAIFLPQQRQPRGRDDETGDAAKSVLVKPGGNGQPVSPPSRACNRSVEMVVLANFSRSDLARTERPYSCAGLSIYRMSFTLVSLACFRLTLHRPLSSPGPGMAKRRVRKSIFLSPKDCPGFNGIPVREIPKPAFGDDLREKRLVRVLPSDCMVDIGVMVVYPGRRHLNAKERVMVDFPAETSRGLPASDQGLLNPRISHPLLFATRSFLPINRQVGQRPATVRVHPPAGPQAMKGRFGTWSRPDRRRRYS